PSGVGVGSGDQVSANIDYADLLGTGGWLTDGTAFSYFNAGPNSSEGSFAVTVQSGTSTVEWGTAATQTSLFDLEQITLSYSGLPIDKYYEVLMTVHNADNTSGIGGNYQSLATGVGPVITSQQLVDTNFRLYRHSLPFAANESGTLTLNINRDNGYRTAVSQVWLVERSGSESDLPTVSITSPLLGAHVSGSSIMIQGQADDGLSLSALVVEVGIDNGQGIDWRAVTSIETDGSWSYGWSLPADGSYSLSARVTDESGNTGIITSPVTVNVNNTPPAPATGISASDGEQDNGGQVALFWQLSSDDGSGVNDVLQYHIERSLNGANNFSPVGSISAGNNSFTDSSSVDGTLYDYRIIAEDLGGNRSTSLVYGPIASIDNNSIVDAQPAEDVTSLSAVAGNERIALSWVASADSNLDLVDQLLAISTDSGVSWSSDASLGKLNTTHLQEGLTNGVTYRFRLRVKDSSG
ncbi:MAG: hypothetical protein GY779_16810, partial [Gammaproteobacteria bacterium]|nr:hypothetical protein [Gammaproteobacteria bacterium]